jgi:hypothetical protein
MIIIIVILKIINCHFLYCNGIPGRGNIFCLSTAFRPALGPTKPPILPGEHFPGVKLPVREADDSLSSAEVKSSGAIPSVVHVSSWHSA